jgi:hypothetical protein
MSDRSAAANHRPLSTTALHHTMADFRDSAVTTSVVTWLGAPLAIADAAERTARLLGGARD